MKYAFVLAVVAAFAASPALAGGKGKGGGALLGGVIAPITTSVGKVNALNNVSVLSGNQIANGTKVNAPIKAIVAKNGLVGGLLGGGYGHGCGCN